MNPSSPTRPPIPPSGGLRRLAAIGPGIALAATGVGAGDMVAAAVSGARYGHALIWAAIVGAVLKLALNEGLARWQLATGSTLLEGWVRHLGRPVVVAFAAYLVLWTVVVGAALAAACGLAAHAVAPALSVPAWAAIHSILAVGVVLAGGYGAFERLMKVLVAGMFVAIVGTALTIEPPTRLMLDTWRHAALPEGSVRFALGVIGGVGGSVTLLTYGYWIREKGWRGERFLGAVRVDLGVAYLATGLFAAAVMALAATVLRPQGLEVAGQSGVLQMAEMLVPRLGGAGRWLFLGGFWAAVATSMIGVWQGVPYLFADLFALLRRAGEAERAALVSTRSLAYRAALAFVAFPPLLLVAFGRPVGLIVVYAVVGSLFMPFLAGTLLALNTRARLVGERMRSGIVANGALVIALALFLVLAAVELVERLG